ncbi:MAG: tRNA (guanosine(37)-N1)-methyltransferase TrmD [Nitrosomonadaceae bacterium]|nr:tRNA (guanosine(37)-N1)-methyltransferase TrmD [Nitrosomonadaceae bacterium]|tara:strand:- start:411 stop:1196 length:786 start_codon:yes stop_codon:yes gene_type:complete
MTFEFDVITLFPEMFDCITKYGVTGRAEKNNLYNLHTWDPRDFTKDTRRTVDDRPFGGGPGMVMLAQPLEKCVTAAKIRQEKCGVSDTRVVYLTPQGRTLDHKLVKEFSRLSGLILISGRYEGLDERLIKQQVQDEVSIGDYVLSGGELPVMVLIDCIARQIPGVLGDPESASQDSFVDELLDCPHYTRPESYLGNVVPNVLLSGDHDKIRRWRLQQSLGRTWLRRPDLLKSKIEQGITIEEKELLEEFKIAYGANKNKVN